MDKAIKEGRVVIPPKGKVPQQKLYLDEVKGRYIENLWDDVPPLHHAGERKYSYPTQKPLKLYKRMIKAASRKGGMVLDPFCGSGTTLVAAQQLGRKYMGCDLNADAVKIAKKRLKELPGDTL